MQISLKIIRSINHAKSTVCIKFQFLVTFSSLFTASSSLSVFPPSVLHVVAFSRLEMSICIYTTIDLSGQTQIFSRNKAPLKAAVNQLNGRLVGLPFCPPVCLIYLMSTLFWAADPKGTMSFRAGGISVHPSVRPSEWMFEHPSVPPPEGPAPPHPSPQALRDPPQGPAPLFQASSHPPGLVPP